MNIKKNEHVIKEVFPGSIAEEMEIEPGDVLLAVNGQDVEDVFDYRYMIKDEYIEVLVRKPDGEEWLSLIHIYVMVRRTKRGMDDGKIIRNRRGAGRP